MKQQFLTEQEAFWAGEFGNEYIARNSYEDRSIIAGNIALFSAVLRRCSGVKSVMEFGSNIGLNLAAIRTLLPGLEQVEAVEINHKAAEILRNAQKDVTVYEQSILDFVPKQPYDFVLIKGVLIHSNPDMLQQIYEVLQRSAGKYLCICEYYNPSPVEIPYRGNTGKLFKRDFAGEFLDLYPEFSLVDYGFTYHRDNQFPQDDITWFLLQRQG